MSVNQSAQQKSDAARPKKPLPATPGVGRSPEEIIAQQKIDAARLKQQQASAARATQQPKAAPAKVPAVKPAAAPPAPAVVDNRTPQERYLDEIAPSFIVGRLVKFSKEGQFITADDSQVISEDADLYALCGDVQIGWIKFSPDEGVPPERHMGLRYDGFVMPPRESLGDSDPAEWPAGLDGHPSDPWLHQMNLVLQQCDTKELFTYSTQNKTGRRAVGLLLRHYERMLRAAPDDVPIVRLRVGGYQHKDARIGWVSTPMFVVVGHAPRDEAAKPELPPPDTSAGGDMNDSIPF